MRGVSVLCIMGGDKVYQNIGWVTPRVENSPNLRCSLRRHLHLGSRMRVSHGVHAPPSCSRINTHDLNQEDFFNSIKKITG